MFVSESSQNAPINMFVGMLHHDRTRTFVCDCQCVRLPEMLDSCALDLSVIFYVTWPLMSRARELDTTPSGESGLPDSPSLLLS